MITLRISTGTNMPSLRETCPAKVEEILNRFPQKSSAAIPLLYLAWETYGYISEAAMIETADILGTTPATIQGIATFYTMFPMNKRGKYHIEVCQNISCHLMGAQKLMNRIENKLGIRCGECTGDGRFSLAKAECLAGCSWGPCLHINGKEYLQLTPEKAAEILDSLLRL